MNNDAYLRRINRELRSVERDVFARLRPLLITSLVQVRNLLLQAIPDEGLSRRLSYLAIKPRLEEALVTFNDTFKVVLADTLAELQVTTLGLAHDRLNGPTSTYEFFAASELLQLVKVFGGWSLQDYFQRRSPSQFMKEILRLVDRTVERGLLQGLPTEEIVRQIVPEVVSRTGKPLLTIRKGTVLNAIRNRVEGTIAQAIWTVATQSERQVWDDDEVSEWIWSAVLDERTCPICTALDNRVEESRDDFPYSPPVHPNCVLGDTPVTAGGLLAATRAIYSGDIVTIRTESGSQITVTAQHPMLTDRGWVRANELANGVHLIRHCERVPSTLDLPNLDNAPPTAAEVFQSFRASQGVVTSAVPASPVYFHGDGEHIQGEIEVVTSHRPLQMNPAAQLLKRGEKLHRVSANAELEFMTGLSPTDLLLLAVNATTNGFVGLAHDALALFHGRGSHADAHRFATATLNNPALLEPVYEHTPRTAALLSELLDGCSEFVAADQVIDIQIKAAHGVTVYDFTTRSGIYMADQLLGHNCRCRILPL